MTERPDELIAGRCSKCLSNCTFDRDEQYPDLLVSVCCGWAPLNLPEEADEA